MADEILSFESEAKRGLVSIIMPTRNGERFIGETLDSIGRQTYTNWEVIIVEDASHGATCEIARNFTRKHRRHRVDYSRNERPCGAGHTRNIAFRKARGEFIALLDCDDRWLPDHLQATTSALIASGKDIAYSASIMIEDQTELLLGVWGPTTHELATFPLSLFGRSFVTPSASVMRRQVLADVGPWDTHYHYCEDFAYWLRCVGAGKTFQYVPGVHCLYRKNHAGATTTRLCGTLEEVAQITEHYMNLPGLKHDTCRRFAAKAYYAAAQFHLKQNPRFDSSADPARAAQLILHAWRLRPKHVDWLWQGVAGSIGNLFRRRRKIQINPSPVDVPAQPILQSAA